MLGEFVFDAGDRHRAEAAQRLEDHLVGGGLRLGVEGGLVGVEFGEEVSGLEQAQGFAGVAERQRVGLAAVEVDDEALVEAVEAPDDAEAPGLVEAEGARLAREQRFEAAQGFGGGDGAEAGALDHGGLDAVLVGGDGERLAEVLREGGRVAAPFRPQLQDADEGLDFAFLLVGILEDEEAVGEPLFLSAFVEGHDHLPKFRDGEGTYVEGREEALLDAVGGDGSGRGFVGHGRLRGWVLRCSRRAAVGTPPGGAVAVSPAARP